MSAGQATASPEYREVQRRLSTGWNTFDTRSVLTQVHLPDGLGVSLAVKEYFRGLTLRTTQIGRRGEFDESVTFGPHAIDGSYTEVEVRWLGIRLHVRTAHDGDDLVALVEPVENQAYPATLVISAAYLWGLPGTSRVDAGRLVAEHDGSATRVFASGASVDDPYLDVDGPRLARRLDGPIGISTGHERSVDEIRAVIEAAAEVLANGSVDDHDDIVRDAVAWNTLYEPSKRRVITQVSRLWNVVKRGGYAMFCWDAFFGALLAARNSTDLAVANVLEMLAEATPEGFVPNVAQGTGRVTFDGSQPPFASLITWEIARDADLPWLLREAFPVLLSWNRWWWRVRRSGDLLAPGSTAFEPAFPSPQDIPRIHQHFGATCEAGADDHPVFADVPFDEDTSLLRAHDIGLNSEYVLDCEMLARIADELGEAEAAEELRERGECVSASVRERLWSEETGIFRSRFTDTGEPTAYLSAMNFFPFFAGLADEEQAERMVASYLREPRKFGGEWVVPSSPRDDERSDRQSYWYGRAWPPLNFLIYLGLLRTGRTEDRQWIAERSGALVLGEWREHRHIHENYSSATGEGCDVPNSEPFLTWGALLSLIVLLEEGRSPYFSDWRDHAPIPAGPAAPASRAPSLARSAPEGTSDEGAQQ
jgi:hypothetical protein